jgi:CRP/FNR family transcriptional regulator, cyclic AMP receptor protein
MDRSDVAGISLFASISPESADLVAAGEVANVPAGQVLARGGDVGEGMFVVLAGRVVAERGTMHAEMGPGDIVGELSLLADHAHRVARVRALTDARILAVDRATFDTLLENEPSFARALLKELATRLIEARTGH